MIPINEIFGPTIQGEGPYVGQPCFFLRTHGCPVQCPGCDTHYTWDGSEKAKGMTMAEVLEALLKEPRDYKKYGLVVSGGEPLSLCGLDDFVELIARCRQIFKWVQLETSGMIPGWREGKPARDRVSRLLMHFDHVCISPKITPCLHGKQSLGDVSESVNLVLVGMGLSCLQRLRAAGESVGILALATIKFVVRDEVDVLHVDRFLAYQKAIVDQQRKGVSRLLQVDFSRFPIQLMPYGIESEEVVRIGTYVVTPACLERGWTVTPRLHSIYWGPKRKV